MLRYGNYYKVLPLVYYFNKHATRKKTFTQSSWIFAHIHVVSEMKLTENRFGGTRCSSMVIVWPIPHDGPIDLFDWLLYVTARILHPA